MAYKLPFTKLLHHPTRNLLILVFGSQFHALDTSTGSLISTTRSLFPSPSVNDNSIDITATVNSTEFDNFSSDSTYLKYVIPSTDAHQATIRTLAFHERVYSDISSSSIPSTLLATSDENKILKVWDCDKWKLRNTRPVPKRIMAMAFNKDGSQIVTADKFGDVHSYPLDPPDDAFNLLLGHVSMVTDMIITPNNKYVITCDRDEHIRVSRFPNGYHIESYCLGHKQFLSKIHILPWANDLLISAGGDDFIALWDYVPGTLLQTLNVKEIIETKKHYDDKEAVEVTNVDTEDSSEIAITSITSSPVSQHIALTIEKFPGIVIFNWNETEKKIQYLQTLHLSIDPLDLAYDISGNLWVSNYIKEEQSNEGLITVFRKNDNEYEKVPDDHPLVKQINEYGSVTVENVPDLYTVGQLRKSLVDWREQDEDDNEQSVEGEESNAASGSSGPSSKQKKSQGTKRNKKRVKLE